MGIEADVKDFLRSLKNLEKYFDGKRLRSFGDIGEVIVSQMYNIQLCEKKNAKDIDGYDSQGRGWQIKASFTENRNSCNCPRKGSSTYGYLALVVRDDGTVEEVYNGPWEIAEGLLSPAAAMEDEHRMINKNKLRAANNEIDPQDKLPRK